MYAECCFCCKHKWSDIKGSVWFRWNPVSFYFYKCFHCFDKHINREFRHTKSCIGIDHSLCVHLRTEQLDFAFCCTVCFHTFECFLRIVKCHACRIHCDRSFRNDSCIFPSVFFCPIHDKHVICHILTKTKILLVWFLL